MSLSKLWTTGTPALFATANASQLTAALTAWQPPASRCLSHSLDLCFVYRTCRFADTRDAARSSSQMGCLRALQSAVGFTRSAAPFAMFNTQRCAEPLFESEAREPSGHCAFFMQCPQFFAMHSSESDNCRAAIEDCIDCDFDAVSDRTIALVSCDPRHSAACAAGLAIHCKLSMQFSPEANGNCDSRSNFIDNDSDAITD